MSPAAAMGVAWLALLLATVSEAGTDIDWGFLSAIFRANGSELTFLCGAVVIHRDWALSNAYVSTAFQGAPHELLVKTGVIQHRRDLEHRVLELFGHPLFELSRSTQYDISLAHVDPPFRTVEPVPITYQVFPWIQYECTVLGYSQDNATWRDFTSNLIGAKPLTYCLRDLKHNFAELDVSHAIQDKSYQYLCSMALLETTDLPCAGQLSGVLICNDVLVGILNQENSCQRRHMPGIFSDLGRNFEWVRSRINDLVAADPMESRGGRLLLDHPLLLLGGVLASVALRLR